jgi:CubicO group peptidase (beta-lactamase class C family)
MTRIRGLAPLLAMLCVATIAHADGLSGPADPELAGFSAARLPRIGAWLQSKADMLKPTDPVIPGAVVAIVRQGRLAYLQAVGFQDRAKTIPMRTNSIFWIASMTKPVTSVAAMILVEEGKLELDAPVATYLPEFSTAKVARAEEKGGYALEPPHRAMTVRDLLRHTSGLIYPEMDFADPGPASEAIHALYNSKPIFESDSTLADFVAGLATFPLAHEPGEVWEYSWGVDVLARVVEVASGKPFDKFLQTRIFDPLKMVDTGFFVPPGKLNRLVDAPGGRMPRFDISKPRKLLSGGGGLASTAPDYLRFCQMLLNGGELDGARILGPHAVAAMTTDAMPSGVHFAGSLVGPKYGTSWGLGFEIRTDPITSHAPGSVGSFRWSGAWGTYFWVDPAEKMAVVQMIQALPGTAEEAFGAIRRLAYGALTIPDQSEVETSQAATSPEGLSAYEGIYAFGRSTSARDPDVSPPFGGIGLDVGRVGGEFKVLRNPRPPSPADRAGLRAGDVILAVDGVATAGLDIDASIAALRGAPGTSVALEIRRPGVEGSQRIVAVRQLIYRRDVEVDIRVTDGGLVAEADGLWPILDFDLGKPIRLSPMVSDEFRASGDDHTRLRFVRDANGKISGAILDPGSAELDGVRID